jgi:hypothetical protein
MEDECYIVPYDLEYYVRFLETGIIGDAYNEEIVDLEYYIRFLETGNPYNQEIWDYMGHGNTFGFDEEYNKVRLEDRWIRDHMYKLNLGEMHGLVEVKMVKDIGELDCHIWKIRKIFRGCNPIIAGGAALYAAGGTDKYGDIDVFFIGEDCDRAEKILIQNKDWFEFNDRCATYRLDSYNFQVIFRKYKSLTEIIHGFDVDCCGFLMDGNKVYATKRAKYSLDNKVNWFDPDRMSSSYVFRLAKYASRGFEIKCPGITIKNVDVMAIERDILQYGNYNRYMGYINTKPPLPDPATYMEYYRTLELSGIGLGYLQLIMLDSIRNRRPHMKTVFEDLFYRFKVDYATLLFMAAYMKIYPPSCNSTYDNEDSIIGDNIESKDVVTKQRYDDFSGKITWIEQDPMTQVTTTFNPLPILDIHDYYSMSKYYVE